MSNPAVNDHPTNRLNMMQAAFVIARRDIGAILFSKAFLLFLIGPLFFLGISAAAGMIGANSAQSADRPKMAVVLPADEASAFQQAHTRLDELVGLPEIELIDAGDQADTQTLLTDRNRNFGAVVSGSLAEPIMEGTADRLDRWQGDVALIAATAQGTPGSFPSVTLNATQSSMAATRSVNAKTATAALTLMFLLTMLLAGMVLSNLVEEKGNKIIEILAASIPMDAVFLGKLFAMLVISFIGIAVWGSMVGILLALGSETLPAIPPPAVGWPLFVALFLVYFAMAYLLIGSVFLAVGSMAPTVRDVQTISMPATILQLAVFFLASFAMRDMGSPVELFALAFPLSSPFSMVARGAQDSTLWIHGAALLWQAMWVTIFVKVGASLFRRKVMKSGPAKVKTKRKPFWKRTAPQNAETASNA